MIFREYSESHSNYKLSLVQERSGSRIYRRLESRVLLISYHATKWAVERLSEAMRYELRRFNIRVKIIEPGGIRTNFINHGALWAPHPAYTDMENHVKHFMEMINDSLPKPEGVAKAIYKAANDKSDRLRYSPYGEAVFLLHAILPDKLWRTLVENIMLGKTSTPTLKE